MVLFSPPFGFARSNNTTGTGQHADTDLVIFFDVDHSLFTEIVQIQATFFIQELALFVEAGALAVAGVDVCLI